MEATNITRAQLEQAAREVGVDFRYITEETAIRSTSGVRLKFTLCPADDRKYERRSYTGRRIHAVCWHGHRDFMRAAYRLAPGMILKSGIARYIGSEHFEKSHSITGYRNIGSQMQPMLHHDACECV